MTAGTKPAELRELSEEELVGRLREAKAELFNLRVQSATGQLDNNRRLQVIRRDIARSTRSCASGSLVSRPRLRKSLRWHEHERN